MARLVVSFAARADVPDEQLPALFDTIAYVRGVVDVLPLVSGTTVPTLKRMGTAVLTDGADANQVAQAIRALPGVDYADMPAERGPL